MTQPVRTSGRARNLRLGAVLGLAVLMGCAAQRMVAPTATPTGDDAPVTLRNLQVANADGHRAVLLRLSRMPTQVRHSSTRHPAQITVQAWGPAGGGDLPERAVPQVDPQIAQISVSRHEGMLRVVFGFTGDEPPPYSVHQMADWIMIRLDVPES